MQIDKQGVVLESLRDCSYTALWFLPSLVVIPLGARVRENND